MYIPILIHVYTVNRVTVSPSQFKDWLVPLQQVQCVHTQYMMYIQRGDSALMVVASSDKTGVKDLVEGGADLNLQNNVCQ